MLDILKMITKVIIYRSILLYEGLLFLRLQQIQHKLIIKVNKVNPDKTIKGVDIGIKDLT